MRFGPATVDEALVFAIEELKADTQYEILRALAQAGMTQADLARKLGVSAAWVSQMLGDDANLTIDSIAKIFLALSMQCRFSAGPVEAHFAQVEMPSRLGADVWSHPQKLEHAGFSRSASRETTTAMLMRNIRSNCGGRTITMMNDNANKQGSKRADVVAA